jgi:putative DNA primase/helicase
VEDLTGCPYSTDHEEGAFRFQLPSGYVDVRCHHNRCDGKTLKTESHLFPRSQQLKADAERRSQGTLIAGGTRAGSANGHAGSASTKQEESAGRVPVLVTLSDVEAQRIEWLWRNWLPRRMLAILGGYGGDGKSTLLAYLLATLSRGGMLPDGTRAPVVNSLMLAAEDDAAYAIRPRLDVHRADPTRVHLLRGAQRENGTQEWVDLKRDADIMRGIVRQYDIGLVAIDPLSSYMPKADRNSEGDVRDALMPLQQLMEDTGVAVIGVMHVGKADAQRRASERLLGSTAFTALARTVWMVHDLPDEYQPDTGPDTVTGKRKVLGVVKANYSIPPRPLAFSRPLDGPLVFHGPSPVSIEEAFAGTPKGKKQDEAAEWLADYLKGGMKATQEVTEAAERAGINERTLRRARETLKVRTHKERTTGGRWFLSLPSGAAEAEEELASLHNEQSPKDDQSKNLALFPESQEDDQLLPGGRLRAVDSREIKGGQHPSIDKLAAFDSSTQKETTAALDPTGTDDTWSMDV